MGSERHDPTLELLKLHDRMNRMFGFGRAHEDDLIGGSWTPPCDILETRDSVILHAELPGVKEKDIEISIENSVLTLRGERTLEKETEERSYHRVERAYGHFARSFTLPRTVDPERISAAFRDGVLEVRMPKREENKPRSIKIGVTRDIESKP